MKALSPKQKKFLYGQLVFGKARIIAKPFYDILIGGILFANRALDLLQPKDKSDISDLSIIIKTFERDSAVKRLVLSIKRRYPSAQIMIVNDSKNPQTFDGVENLTMPYDTGISAGRNLAIDKITTPYFLLLDDDFVFSRRQNLGLLMEQMKEHPGIDILGGRYIDLPFFIKHNFQDMAVPSNAAPVTPINTQLGDNRVVDKVQNYFVARTAAVRKVRWDERLKTLEHTDFFSRAKGVLTTAFRDDMLILHAKTPFDIAYLKKRFR